MSYTATDCEIFGSGFSGVSEYRCWLFGWLLMNSAPPPWPLSSATFLKAYCLCPFGSVPISESVSSPRWPVDQTGPTILGPPTASNEIKFPPNPPFVGIEPVKLGPRLLTPASQLKPPYPASKLLTEEEATLRLRLTIDERGRVIAVEPVGRADSVFLAAARRHLLGHWRYQPASEGGHAVSSSTVVTLRFQLDG